MGIKEFFKIAAAAMLGTIVGRLISEKLFDLYYNDVIEQDIQELVDLRDREDDDLK